MRIYLAGSMGDRQRLAIMAKKVRRMGHEVTSRWHDECAFFSMTNEDIAQNDIADIVKSDAVVVVQGASTSGGYHWEAGFAYGLASKSAASLPAPRVVSVGEVRNPFYHAPGVVRLADEEALGEWLLAATTSS